MDSDPGEVDGFGDSFLCPHGQNKSSHGAVDALWTLPIAETWRKQLGTLRTDTKYDQRYVLPQGWTNLGERMDLPAEQFPGTMVWLDLPRMGR